MGKSNDRITRQLLDEIDDEGTGLSRREIAFVAELIDGNVTTFDLQTERRIKQLHDRRVVNGTGID